LSYLSPHGDSRLRRALVARGQIVLVALALCCAVAAGGCVNGEGVGALRNTSASRNSDVPGAARKGVRVQRGAVPATAATTKGAVLIAGGVGPSLSTLASAEYFDPSSTEFVATGSAAKSRAGASAAPLPEPPAPTMILLDGGFSGSAEVKHFSLGLEGLVLASAEVYDAATGVFTPAGAMVTPRMGFTATALGNGKILVAGGLDNSGDVLDSAEIFDPATRKFVAVNNPMSDRRIFHTATMLPNRKVLLAGGATNLSGDTSSSADLYDPASNSFTPVTASMDHQRAAHTATLLTVGPLAGRVLITGGGGGSGMFLKDSSAEIYDPALGQFVLLSSFLNEPRSMHTATVLNDGSVLLVGGFDGSAAISGGMLSSASGLTSNSAEVFDPNTLEFACVGGFNNSLLRCNQSMAVARAGHTATMLTGYGLLGHRVLVAGGVGGIRPDLPGVPLSSAEAFNPAGGGSFALVGSMATARVFHTATPLR
jgi:hypothetical protein